MSLLDLPIELLLLIFTRLIGQFIHQLVFNVSIYHLWDPVTTLQLLCRPTRTLVLSICRQIAALPTDDPHQTVDPLRVIAPYQGLAFSAPATLSLLLADNTAPPLLQAYTMLTSTLIISLDSAMRIDEAISVLITAEHRAKQVVPRELSEFVLDGIEQHSELIAWEKRFSKWIDAMVRARSRPNEITDENQEDIDDCLQALDNNIIPQRVLQTSGLGSVATNLAKHARKAQEAKQSLEYLDLSFTSPTVLSLAPLRPCNDQFSDRHGRE